MPYPLDENYETTTLSFDYVLFDLDGLLLDTEKIYSQINNDICQKYAGKDYPVEVKRLQMGKKPAEAAQIFVDQMKIPLSATEYAEMMKPLLEAAFKKTDLLPGAHRLVKHFDKIGVPMAIATGSCESTYLQKIEQHMHTIGRLMRLVVCSGSDPEVRHGKPAPDCFLVCARRLHDLCNGNGKHLLNMSRVLVFEDAGNGVEAAVAAGAHCVWVPSLAYSDPATREPVLSALGPQARARVHVLESLEEFRPELFGWTAIEA